MWRRNPKCWKMWSNLDLHNERKKKRIKGIDRLDWMDIVHCYLEQNNIWGGNLLLSESASHYARKYYTICTYVCCLGRDYTAVCVWVSVPNFSLSRQTKLVFHKLFVEKRMSQYILLLLDWGWWRLFKVGRLLCVWILKIGENLDIDGVSEFFRDFVLFLCITQKSHSSFLRVFSIVLTRFLYFYLDIPLFWRLYYHGLCYYLCESFLHWALL